MSSKYEEALSVTFYRVTYFEQNDGWFLISKFIAVYTGTTGMALLGQAQNLITMLNGIVNAPTSNAVVRYTSEYCDKVMQHARPGGALPYNGR